jgi:hypothetical protein
MGAGNSCGAPEHERTAGGGGGLGPIPTITENARSNLNVADPVVLLPGVFSFF